MLTNRSRRVKILKFLFAPPFAWHQRHVVRKSLVNSFQAFSFTTWRLCQAKGGANRNFKIFILLNGIINKIGQTPTLICLLFLNALRKNRQTNRVATLPNFVVWLTAISWRCVCDEREQIIFSRIWYFTSRYLEHMCITISLYNDARMHIYIHICA